MKERFGYAALDFEGELREHATSRKFQKTFELPDGNTVTIDSERFRCAEALFQPSLIGLDTPGVHDMVYESLMSVEVELRRDFFANLFVSGGCTMFPEIIMSYRKMLSSSNSDDAAAVVIDNGSGTCKAGFAGDYAPRSIFPSVIGRPRNVSNEDLKEFYVGNEAQAKRELLSLKHPMECGIVTDWEDMEKIWRHIYHKELRAETHENPVLLTEPPLNPTINREKMAEIFFERFYCPAFYLSISGKLATYAAAGRCTALILDIGDTVSHVLPIYEGYCPHQAIRRLDIGGRDITAYLQRLLYLRGYSFNSSSEFELVNQMKEKLGYVAIDFEQEVKESVASTRFQNDFELPDGTIITLGSERFRCTEVLFKPSLIGLDAPGVHEMVYDSLMAVDVDLRRDLFANIVLSGGCTMFDGFERRLLREIEAKAPLSMKVKVVHPPERKCSVWIGGSVMASLPSFQQLWIAVQEYEEYGPSIVARKSL